MSAPLSAPAPAKVNLVLEVTGRRADGYHEIDTVLQTLTLADTVTLQPWRAGARVTVSGPAAAGTPADETNLAWRALRHTSPAGPPGLRLELEKRIPAAGGLGGGSSDAATALRLIQRYDPSIDERTVYHAAISVGSDEAFFLVGGTARAQGRGERVTPLPDLEPHDVVLFLPRRTIEKKTARMFAALQGAGFDDGSVVSAFVAERRRTVTSADIHNAFERVAFDVFEGLGRLWEQLESRVGEPVRLSGAGPALFWIGRPGLGDVVAERAAGADCDIVSCATARSLWRR
jgi:4-diphosphocytidyl-2-C-methyl-D-erythritol kinase